jgi:glycosyltransferase involved in cell wall biosynthesis
MKIFLLSRTYSSHDARFLTAIVGAGHEAWFCALSGSASPAAAPVASVRYVDPPMEGSPGELGDIAMLVPSFMRMLDQIRPDILHAGPVQDCGLLAALSGFHPFILMSWGFDLLVDAPASEEAGEATRRAIAAADAFVCDSVVVQEAASHFGLSAVSEVVRFPWGVDLEMFSSIRRAPTDVVNVLSTRNWEEMYGIETLLNAFVLAARRDARFRLTMLGRGSLEYRIRSLVSDFGLAASVDIPGLVSQQEIPKYVQDAHVYASCTPSDGSSISLLESLASGLPVVVADSPGNREWVTERNGWLVRSTTPGPYADALLACASLPEDEYLDMSRSNRDLAADRADWNRNVPLLLDLYDRVGHQVPNRRSVP